MNYRGMNFPRTNSGSRKKIYSVSIIAGMIFFQCFAESVAVQPPEHFKEVGGSNYVMYNVSREYLDGNQNAWYKPGVLQPVVGTFHLQKKEDVQRQLQEMYLSGQRKIAILMWYDHLNPEQLQAGGVHGHALASNGGQLLPQHKQNLSDLLTLVRETGGFNELIFRFAAQGAACPNKWEQWNEDQYLENFSLARSVREQVNCVMQGSGINVTFDLGVELGGIESGFTDEYTQRFWGEYVKLFGSGDTFGFSIAVQPGRVERWIKATDRAGTRPGVFALDMYNRIPEQMRKLIAEFHAAGIKTPEIIILETYYNDLQSLHELQQAAVENNIEYRYLMQWPFKRGASVPHLSDVFAAPQYDAYLRPAVANPALEK